MTDWISGYERLFVPHGEGYVFHPTKKSGGKFVTGAEHARLIADMRRFQRLGPIAIAVVAGVAIVTWMIVDDALNLPDWAEGVFLAATIAAVCARVFWVFLAPYRLVKGREAVVPPRLRAEVAREARAMLSWPQLILFGLAGVVALLSSLFAPERTLSVWAWIAGSAVLLGGCLWVGFRKFGDGA